MVVFLPLYLESYPLLLRHCCTVQNPSSSYGFEDYVEENVFACFACKSMNALRCLKHLVAYFRMSSGAWNRRGHDDILIRFLMHDSFR